MKPKRLRKYRTGVNVKSLKQLNVRVPDTIHDLVQINTVDENGRKIPKDQVVAEMIAFAAARMNKPRSI